MSLNKTKTDEEIKNYITQMKEIYEHFLLFISNQDYFGDIYYNKLLDIMNRYEIEQSKEKFNHFIEILINVANNHHRPAGFFNKIERILTNYKDTIIKSKTNTEIYEQFESNKRLVYFLIKEQILTKDDEMMQMIEDKIEFNGIRYSDFFLPEIEKLDLDADNYKTLSYYIANEEEYEAKRQIGENDSYICTLIRQDSIEEFVKYVNQTNLPLSSIIEPSIFETNSFLIENEPTLIEYAAFCGSIQIFQYLYLNKVEANGSLWLYGIHSNNFELLRNCFEENHIEPIDKTYKEILNESIKCHHNEIASYITEYKMTKNLFDEVFFRSVFKYHNYFFFPKQFNQNYAFFYFCKYKYESIVDSLFKLKERYIKTKIHIIKFNDV